MYHFVIALCAISALIAALEIIARTNQFSKVFMRKLAHVSVSLLICLLVPYAGYHLFVPLGLLFVLILYLAHFLYPLKSLADRSDESYGEVFFPFGVAAAATLCQNSAQFVTIVIIMGLADTLAFAIGRRFSSPKLFRSKTLFGSLACALGTFSICLFTINPLSAMVVAIFASGTELISTRGSDNATIPIVTSLLIVYVV